MSASHSTIIFVLILLKNIVRIVNIIKNNRMNAQRIRRLQQNPFAALIHVVPLTFLADGNIVKCVAQGIYMIKFKW